MKNLTIKRNNYRDNCLPAARCALRLLVILFLCFKASVNSACAQKLSVFEEGILLTEISMKDGKTAESKLKKWLLSQWDDGYLGASIDSVRQDSLDTFAYASRGPRLKWGYLNISDSLGVIDNIGQLGFHWKPGKRAASIQSFSLYREEALRRLENMGYPFATASFQHLTFQGDTLSASLDIEKGPLILFDSLLLRSDARINPLFLKNYLEIRSGAAYSEKTVRRISTRIQEIPFLKESKSSEILFAENKANVYLYLEEQKASFANGVVGLQPNPSTGEIVITGQLELKLLNAVKRGELFNLSWRKLQSQTQDIFVQLQYPYLFSTPIAIGGQLKIYRRDTTFSTIDSKLELAYLLRGGNKVSAFIAQSQANRLAEVSTFNGVVGNINTNSYGLELDYQRLDYRFNPRKGFGINLIGTVGTKRLRDSVLVGDGQFLPSRSSQYSLSTDLQFFQPIAKRMSLLFRLRGAITENPFILENEMYRIGGLRILRGFDEESFFANQYLVGTIEWRYILGRNSRYFVFADPGWFRRESPELSIEDSPLGFGTGISFETKAGIFSLTYALGQAFDNPILLRAAKIHFGFTSLF